MAIAALLPVVGKVIDRIIPDPTAKAAAKQNMFEAIQRGELAELDADVKLAAGQMEINKSEAAHSSIFVAGWRPAIGWICGVALAYNFVVYPFLGFIGSVAGLDLSNVPELETGEMMTVLLGMLGLGGMRSFEKRNRVAQESLQPQSPRGT